MRDALRRQRYSSEVLLLVFYIHMMMAETPLFPSRSILSGSILDSPRRRLWFRDHHGHGRVTRSPQIVKYIRCSIDPFRSANRTQPRPKRLRSLSLPRQLLPRIRALLERLLPPRSIVIWYRSIAMFQPLLQNVPPPAAMLYLKPSLSCVRERPYFFLS